MRVQRWHEPSIPRWVRWFTTILFLIYALPGLFSSYRAWVQVRSLELIVPSRESRVGDTIRVRAVSWARTWVDVDLMLVQGNHTDTLAWHQIPKNHNASIDPLATRFDDCRADPTDALGLSSRNCHVTRNGGRRTPVAANASASDSRDDGPAVAEA